jgi:cell division protein FtsW
MARSRPRTKPPLEYSLIYTATLCLLALGAIMVYSASSAESLLDGSGDPSYYLKRYVALAVVGLVVLHFASRHGLSVVKGVTPVLLLGSFVLTALVMLPGFGVTVNGATRWLGAGPIQFQPSELLKLSLVLFAAQLLAARPSATRSFGALSKPLLIVVALACLLLLKQPDMGTAMVVCFAIGTLLFVAGTPMRLLGAIGGGGAALALAVALIEPYRRERLTAFLDPWSDAGDTGFQSVQSMIAIGSGGPIGVGLGESVQKIFYLPEAHTDMILAIIGEELGLLGIVSVVSLYGLLAYAGFRAAKHARDRYSKLLAAGITSLVMVQAVINLFAVLGLAPLTGVPLPFVSYGNSSMLVLLGGVGLLLNVAGGAKAAGGARLRAIEGGGLRKSSTAGRKRSSSSGGKRRHSRGGNRGTRRSGARSRRRASG